MALSPNHGGGFPRSNYACRTKNQIEDYCIHIVRNSRLFVIFIRLQQLTIIYKGCWWSRALGAWSRRVDLCLREQQALSTGVVPDDMIDTRTRRCC